MTGDDEATVAGEAPTGDEAWLLIERRALAYEDLLRQLTAQFQGCAGCERISVVRVTRLDRPDIDGCNWSRSIVLQTAGVPAEVYCLAYARLIRDARGIWNLE